MQNDPATNTAALSALTRVRDQLLRSQRTQQALMTDLDRSHDDRLAAACRYNAYRHSLIYIEVELSVLGWTPEETTEAPAEPAERVAELRVESDQAPAEQPQRPADGAQRPARSGETCSCGRPAVTVIVTDLFGDVGYCGRSDGGHGGHRG